MDDINSFCGLHLLLESDGLMGEFDIVNNGLNPSENDIISNGSCDFSLSTESSTGVQFILTPNPCYNQLSILSSTNSIFKIYNSTGKEILSSQLLKGNNFIDVSHFINGAYYLKIQSHTFPFIKV